MKVQRLSAGWRLGWIIGSKMIRLWAFHWVITFYDGIGPMRGN